MVQVLEKAFFIDPEQEILREGVEYWSYPPADWWMDRVNTALAKQPDIVLHIQAPSATDPGWNAAAYIQSLIREWELYRVHFLLPPRLSMLWMSGGGAWKELLETLRRSFRNWSVGVKVLEVVPGQITEEELVRFRVFGFRQLRLDLTGKWSYHDIASLTDRAREIGYSSIRALMRLDSPGSLRHLRHLHADVLEWADWLEPGPDFAALRKEVRQALEPAGYQEIAPGCFALSHDPLFKAAETGDLSFNLLGYMPRFSRLCLGLGAGAWSDAWSGMVQNEVVPETYQQKLREGGLAPANGIVWSPEACKMRLHRHNLRCLGEVQWGEPGFRCQGLLDALDRMAPLEAAGLVERYADKGLIVTERGKEEWERVMAAM
jgi:hypothetical protein